MKSSRWRVTPGLILAGALVVSGCSPDSAGFAGSDTSAATQVDCTGKPELRASGSTVQHDAIEQFGYAYARACPGRILAYDANGSATGVEQFVGHETDLAGSDVALDPAKGQPERMAARCGSPAWHLPVVFTPIAIAYNIDGVNALTLDGPTAAKIFNGTIGTWDNPAIKALNPAAALPSTPIHVVFDSDRSGITANFQKYLDDASDGAWGGGTGDIFTGGGDEGAIGGSGTAAALRQTDGAVTYTEWSFARGRQLPMAQIVTAADPHPVAISTESVTRTIAGAKFAASGNDLLLEPASLHAPVAADAYPIVVATYEIVCSKYPEGATAAAVKAFLQAAIGPGQEGLEQYGSVPLPEPLRTRLSTAVTAIT